MADIIQLVEKDVKKYMATHVDAVVGLDDLAGTKNYKVDYKTGFKDYSDYQYIDITVVGGRALITGAFTNTSKISASAEIVIGTLPQECRPKKITTSPRLQGTGSSSFIIEVTPGGDVILSRYKYGTTDNQIDAGSWLAVNMSYNVSE